MQSKVRVLNVSIDAITMAEAVNQVEKMIFIGHETTKPHLIATANAEMVMQSQQDSELATILKVADLVVPDGAGVVWAARHQGQAVPERVAGFDLTQRLLALSAIKGYRLFFLGSSPEVIHKAKAKAEEMYEGIKIVGSQHGFFIKADEPNIIQQIRQKKPDILFVALGVPKQEKWLYHHLMELQVPVSIGVGGTFDVMAGVMKRAPLWMQKLNLEWSYRLIKQPQRIGRMMALPKFVYHVLREKKD